MIETESRFKHLRFENLPIVSNIRTSCFEIELDYGA